MFFSNPSRILKKTAGSKTVLLWEFVFFVVYPIVYGKQHITRFWRQTMNIHESMSQITQEVNRLTSECREFKIRLQEMTELCERQQKLIKRIGASMENESDEDFGNRLAHVLQCKGCSACADGRLSPTLPVFNRVDFAKEICSMIMMYVCRK
jgi:hypothetical protein